MFPQAREGWEGREFQTRMGDVPGERRIGTWKRSTEYKQEFTVGQA